MNKKQRGLLSVLVLTSITGMAFATDTDNLSIGGDRQVMRPIRITLP